MSACVVVVPRMRRAREGDGEVFSSVTVSVLTSMSSRPLLGVSGVSHNPLSDVGVCVHKWVVTDETNHMFKVDTQVCPSSRGKVDLRDLRVEDGTTRVHSTVDRHYT